MKILALLFIVLAFVFINCHEDLENEQHIHSHTHEHVHEHIHEHTHEDATHEHVHQHVHDHEHHHEPEQENEHEHDHELDNEEEHKHEHVQEVPEIQKDGDLWILSDENFEKVVMESDQAFFIKFFAPWCGHCKRLQPDWVKLATEIKDIAIVAEVDCTVHKNMSAKFAIRGYPTLKFFPKGEKSVEKVIDYREARSIEAMKTFVMEHLEQKVEEVKQDL